MESFDILQMATRSEKINFIKWAKENYSKRLLYIFLPNQHSLPTGLIEHQLARNFIADTRFYINDQGQIDTKFLVPSGFTKEEWDDPEKIN
jgi:hypothetical protein